MKQLILIFFLSISQFLIAQDTLRHTFINQKYKGGTETFMKEITSGLTYTKAAKENNYYTIAIVYLKINSQGVLENIQILNRLKYGLDENIKYVFEKNKDNWESSENGYVYYLAITYSLFDNYAKVIRVNYPEIIAENILVSAYPTETDSPVRAQVNYKSAFQQSENGYDKNIRKEYYKKSKYHLSKLIEMDPFYPDYYNGRLTIERYTKSYDYACEDLHILQSLWNIHVKKMKLDCD